MRIRAFVTVAAIVFVGTPILAIVIAGSPDVPKPSDLQQPAQSDPTQNNSAKLETATFASGCFWCAEAVFDQLKDVKSVVSGYSGGQVPDPTYEQVCSGSTGHAEAVQITFDPAVIAFADLLKVFWQTHDPTTLNRQGQDTGTQYRSAIFYHSDAQRDVAEHYKRQLDASGTFRSPIVTEITKFTNFFPAEKYHQDYFQLNPAQGYCTLVIRPKVEKFRKDFRDLLQDAPEKAAPARP